MRRLLQGLLIAAMLSGCVVRERVYAEPGEIEVAEAPPAERVEVVTVAPSPNHLWIRGYWSWSGRTWLWVGGRWEVRRPGHDWVHGHWEARHHRWVFVPGHWRRL